MTQFRPGKVSFSFYPKDMEVLGARLQELGKAGLPLRESALLRALIAFTPPTEMFAHAVLLASALAKKEGPREDDTVAARPTIDLPPEHIDKLDRVAGELARKGVINANRAFVVRATLRALPPGGELVGPVREFLEKFPNKPRGRPAALMAKKKARRG